MIINNLKNIFNNYNHRLGESHLSVYKLSQLTNIPRTTLIRLMKYPSRLMNGKVLNGLIEFFNVPVNELIIYKRDPFKFKLMNASDINSNKLPKRIKKHLLRSVALRSVDYQQTIIFTPYIKFKPSNNPNEFSQVNVKIKYTNITHYPIFKAIQCSNIIKSLKISKLFFNLLKYIEYIAILHGGLISKHDDKQYISGLMAYNIEFQPTNLNSKYFNLSNSKSFISKASNSGGLELINKKLNNRSYLSDSGNFLSPIKYIRKHYGKSVKNGYNLHFKNFNLNDITTLNFAK